MDNRAPRIYDCLRGSNKAIASVSDPSETDYFQRRQRSTERLIERLTEQKFALSYPVETDETSFTVSFRMVRCDGVGLSPGNIASKCGGINSPSTCVKV